jgi:hypothetical protein
MISTVALPSALVSFVAGCASKQAAYPLPRTAFPAPGVYVVQSGDTVNSAAKHLCLSVDRLISLNAGLDLYHLKNGQRIYYTPKPLPLCYRNHRYGFTFFLPLDWRGYSISAQQLEDECSSPTEGKPLVVEHTPMLTFRHPKWDAAAPYQDIPILIFTHAQWDALHAGRLWPSMFAGGIMDELWHNQRFVFAMSSRYNAADDVAGWKEVKEIVEENCVANNTPHLYQE